MVHFLQGHHFGHLSTSDCPLKCQRAVSCCATIFRVCTGTKFSTAVYTHTLTKYQNGLARRSIFLMICKIPSPPRNLVVPSHFLPKTGKLGLTRQKHPQNKVCRACRDIRVTRKTRVEHNKHTSRVQNFNGFHMWDRSLRRCQLVSTKFHRLASLLFPMVPR